MSFFESIKKGFSNHFENKKKEREAFEQMQREAKMEEWKIFQEKFKENALEVARSRASRMAAEKSGLQKLRATNRARRLNESSAPPGSFFEKLGEYTKKNIAKREENLERTKLMRETAKKMREERQAKILKERQERMNRSKTPVKTSGSTWRM